MNEYIRLHELNSTKDDLVMPGYCPISVKAEKNRPGPNKFPKTNREIFLSKKNIYNMTYYIVSLNIKNLTKCPVDELQKITPSYMVKWADDQNIDDFEYLTDDILLTLDFLNKRFLIKHSDLYDGANAKSLNVFRNTGRITDKCNRESDKKFDEMLAADYHTLDLWQPFEAFTYNKKQRYSNKIPVWQSSMNTRTLDRSNDGLHAALPERASLDNQIHGYDMSNIIKGSEYYNNYYYENI
jgi:hypothetical protein